MAYDKNTLKVISVPITKIAHEKLLEIAKKEKRSTAAQGGYLLEQAIANYDKKV